MTDDQTEGHATEIDPSDVESELERLYLQSKMPLAEIDDYVTLHEAGGERKYVQVDFIVSGEQMATDALPVPDTFDEESDLITLLHFTESSPGHLNDLLGKRVPYYDGRVRYDVMRKVLRMEEEAISDWDRERRIKKAEEEVDRL